MTRPAGIVATLLTEYPEILPPTLSKLIQNAPESFDDPRHGRIVEAIRKIVAQGKPVHALTVRDHLNSRDIDSQYLNTFGQHALPLDLAELDAKTLWADYTVRQSRKLLLDAAQAVELKPNAAGNILKHVRVELDRLTADATKQGLPPIHNAAQLLQDVNLVQPDELVEGVLHRGCKAIIGSSSKARKTWILLDLALSVCTGNPFWKWNTKRGRVLYINFEIPESFIKSRIKRLCESKEIPNAGNLDVWTLRGHAASFGRLLPEIIRAVQSNDYALIIVDPIYKCLGGRDENSAGDISELCNELERLAVTTGAAVVFAAHYSKGNQAAKEAQDRIGGSGVFARDADSIITLTKHETEGAFTVDLILRNHAEQLPFVVEWESKLTDQAQHQQVISCLIVRHSGFRHCPDFL